MILYTAFPGAPRRGMFCVDRWQIIDDRRDGLCYNVEKHRKEGG